mgnify:CR=1 FL=1
MENAQPLNVKLRTELGKGANRRLRAQGLLPAVCYGSGSEATALSVDPKELMELLSGDYGFNAVFKLNVENSDMAPVVRVNEYQRDPVRRELTHVDFQILSEDKVVTVTVPLRLTGRPQGTTVGGKLRQIRHSLKIKARPAAIPSELVLDVTELKVNAYSRVTEIPLPEGVEVIYDTNFSVATVFLPRGVKAAEEEE